MYAMAAAITLVSIFYEVHRDTRHFCSGGLGWAIVLFPETLAQKFSMDKEVPREFMGLVIVGLVMAGVSYTNAKKRKAERE